MWVRLFTVEEGGQGRHLQSGFRATWWADGTPHPMAGPIVLAEPGRRSVAPGAGPAPRSLTSAETRR